MFQVHSVSQLFLQSFKKILKIAAWDVSTMLQ